MRELIEATLAFFQTQFGIEIPELYRPWVAAAMAGLGAQVIVTAAAIYAGLFIYLERRIGARMMSRVGPNRVGPHGLLQWVADAVKLIMKEDIIPDAADRPPSCPRRLGEISGPHPLPPKPVGARPRRSRRRVAAPHVVSRRDRHRPRLRARRSPG